MNTALRASLLILILVHLVACRGDGLPYSIPAAPAAATSTTSIDAKDRFYAVSSDVLFDRYLRIYWTSHDNGEDIVYTGDVHCFYDENDNLRRDEKGELLCLARSGAEGYCGRYNPLWGYHASKAPKWRLPTPDEARSIASTGWRRKTECGERTDAPTITCPVDPAFTLTGPAIWTSKFENDETPLAIGVLLPKLQDVWVRIEEPYYMRALCASDVPNDQPPQ